MREHDELLRALKATARLGGFRLVRAAVVDDLKTCSITIRLDTDSAGIIQDELPLDQDRIEYQVGPDGVVQRQNGSNGDAPLGELEKVAAGVAAEAPEAEAAG